MRTVLKIVASIALLCVIPSSTAPSLAEDSLSQLRDEVRTADPPAPRRDRASDRRATSYNPSSDPYNSDTNSDNWGDLLLPAAAVAGIAATSPFWGPPALVGDSYLES